MLWRWLKKRRDSRPEGGTEPAAIQRDVFENKFSPMTYRNPCISRIFPILEYVLDKKHILYQHLELIVIDGETAEDDHDIQMALSQLASRLNYLLLITDRPGCYEDFADDVFEEYGLIVQQIPKSDSRHARGNLILDFERGLDTSGAGMQPEAVYIPVYKKPWEISENLDIMVPVGYNTLVVSGIHLPYTEEYSIENMFEDNFDRLEREFRRG